jgi:hypothetical protein
MQRITMVELIEQLQLFARLEANSLAGRDAHFGASTGISTNTGLAGPNVKNTEAAKFDAVALCQRLLHALKDGIHGRLGFIPWQSRSLHHLMHYVELDHRVHRKRSTKCFPDTMLGGKSSPVNDREVG